jgi:hypothetical protein
VIRIGMLWAIASLLIAVTAITGESAEIGTAASKAASLGAVAVGAVSESVLWSFGGDDGYRPLDGLIADKWGNLYSTTEFGGANSSCVDTRGCGTVFELSPTAGQQTQWRKRAMEFQRKW